MINCSLGEGTCFVYIFLLQCFFVELKLGIFNIFFYELETYITKHIEHPTPSPTKNIQYKYTVYLEKLWK